MRTQPEMKTALGENARNPADVHRNLIEANNMNVPSTVFTKPAQCRRTLPWRRLLLRAQLLLATRKLGIAVATALLLAAPIQSPAAQLSLADTPLFLSGTVQPNIFFLADDSGSMDWNTMTSESDGQIHLTGYNKTITYSYVFSQADNVYGATNTNGRILPDERSVIATTNMPTLAQGAHGVWRSRYSGYNTIYYNPEYTYKPWVGLDAAGVALANASPTAARLDPYKTTGGTNLVNLTTVMSWTADSVPYFTTPPVVPPSTTPASTKNITVNSYYPAQYYTWTDSNSNGVVDATDTHGLVQIRIAGDTTDCSAFTLVSGSTTVSATCPTTFARSAARTDCATINADGTHTCTRTEELQNFANWFSYYRRRILTSKNAIGKVVEPSTARVGFGTLHNNGTVNTQISLMNSAVASGNKKTLLDAVYKNSAGGDTPLRTKLDQVGKYYQCVTGNLFGLTAVCPILPLAQGGSCQRNFTVMTTDGFYNDSYSGVGNTDVATSSAFDGGAYADNWSDTLADVAMNYYETDLSTLSDDVTNVAADHATHQHMVTYTVAFGVDGSLSANPTDPTATFAWPNPASSDAYKIDDLRHAAYNSRGQFLSAKRPGDLADSLTSALGSISGIVGSSASLAVNSHTLTTDSAVYQALFTSGSWSGDLRSYPVTSGGVVDTAHPNWTPTAGVWLTPVMWDTGRHIFTRNTATNAGVAFRWGDLSATQQGYLNTDPVTATSDALGQNRLIWLRGYAGTTGETPYNSFRKRVDSLNGPFVLGDIVNSAPVYVGAPGVIPDSVDPGHTTFSTNNASRLGVIYVGANDGMLHGFDASNGHELMAYVPATLYKDLSKLTDPNYTHRYFADGSPTTGDAYFNSAWHTVLVSGLGAGGKGIFALDVTDPSQFTAESNAASISLWEISATADNDLGYTFSQPTITKVNIGSGNSKWVAIFGNGYNSTNESAALYVVDIADGTLIKKIVVDAGGGNGLSTPLVWDENSDYIADYVYAGDLKGNLWKFDLTGDPASWASAYGTSGTPRPLFKAVDGSGNPQPITERPAVSKQPVATLTGNMVYVGTGRYVASGDKSPSATPKESFYGIWDKGVASTTVPVVRADLLQQTITTTGSVRNISALSSAWRVGTSTVACAADGTGECLGWYVDLPVTGEMSVSNPIVLTSDVVDVPRVIFTSLIPNASVCSAGGDGWLMEMEPIWGRQLPPGLIDVNRDGVIDSNDIGAAGIQPGLGIISEPVVIIDPNTGRLGKALSGSKGGIGSVTQLGKTNPPCTTCGTPPPPPPPPCVHGVDPFCTGVPGRGSWRQIK